MSAYDPHAANREAWDTIGGWSSAPRMNDLEAVMWRAERHPWLSSTIVALEILDTTPNWERLRDAHEWGSRLVPRFRQRVVEPPLHLGPPEWVDDPGFDLDYHLRSVVLPGPGETAQLLELAQTLALTPLDRERPLWEGTLVAGLEGGRAAYVLKAHHCLADGIAGIQLFGGLHSRTREPSAAKRQQEPPRRPASGVIAAAGSEVAGAARGVPGLLARAVPAAAAGLARPRATVGGAARLAASLRRTLTEGGGPPSPLLAGRTGRSWKFEVLECGLDELKAAAHAAGGTVNDAYLAALSGGMRRYHQHHSVALESLPVAMPVSLRRPGDPTGGNRFTAAIFAAPAGLTDPAERVGAIHARVLAARAEPALDVAGLASPLLSRLPAAVALTARSSVGAGADLSASNFPGIRGDAFVAGARVERMFAFGPLPGTAVMATLVSHDGVCCIALNCDGSVIDDPARLRECISAEVEAILALGSPAKARYADGARA
jgi:WS/DGAT/MGAT family acyltransferase